MLATPIYPKSRSTNGRARRTRLFLTFIRSAPATGWRSGIVTGCVSLWFAVVALAWGGDKRVAEATARAESTMMAARERHLNQPNDEVAAWLFARACFDRAEFATNNVERAALAQQGIAVGRMFIAREASLAATHYYLGMNLGQLARTKSLGALKLVDEMEREFKLARALDEQFDFAGPDRNLGLLYLQAPSIGSVGSRSKARQHLERAAALAPNYPDNRLNLAEAYARWNDHAGLRREFKSLEALWPAAKAMFAEENWVLPWLDWERRWERIKEKVANLTRPMDAPRGRPG